MPKPSPRRDGREAAVQYLFGHESLDESEDDRDHFDDFWHLREAGSKARQFAEELIIGIRQHQESIDEAITGSLDNFKFERLTPVDRNILRLATYEICFADYIPAEAAINEAIEIAKRFGTDDSPKFVNGVLDRIWKDNRTN